MIFEGLSGFPITPMRNGEPDFHVLAALRDHIDGCGLDSIGVLGSTGSFAYLNESQRTKVMECWSEASSPWIAGVSASTTQDAIMYCKVAEQNGAKGVIANAFAYVPLSPDELRAYFLGIAENSPLPLCVYDNPVTTGQALSNILLAELASHPNIHACKVFAKPENQEQHRNLNAFDWKPGYAVDPLCCEAMIGGASGWYSTLAGTVPELVVPIMRAIKEKDFTKARALNKLNEPLYLLLKQHSGYRLMHALANQRGWSCELTPPLLCPQIEDLSRFWQE